MTPEQRKAFIAAKSEYYDSDLSLTLEAAMFLAGLAAGQREQRVTDAQICRTIADRMTHDIWGDAAAEECADMIEQPERMDEWLRSPIKDRGQRESAEVLERIREALTAHKLEQLSDIGCIVVIDSYVNPVAITAEDIAWAKGELQREVNDGR